MRALDLGSWGREYSDGTWFRAGCSACCVRVLVGLAQCGFLRWERENRWCLVACRRGDVAGHLVQLVDERGFS